MKLAENAAKSFPQVLGAAFQMPGRTLGMRALHRSVSFLHNRWVATLQCPESILIGSLSRWFLTLKQNSRHGLFLLGKEQGSQ